MMYGENLGTSTLARDLTRIAKELYFGIDDGEPWSELKNEAKNLMEGAMVLWERLVDEEI